MNAKGFWKVILGSMMMVLFLVGCKNESKEGSEGEVAETTVTGSTTILVEESIYPIVEDVASLFEYEYRNAKLHLISKSENEILDMIYKDSTRLAILPRKLDSLEVSDFKGIVNPKMSNFAIDGIVFLAHKTVEDSLVSMEKVLADLTSDTDSGPVYVFDNINSNISIQFREQAGVSTFSNKEVYFLSNTEEVVQYVSENPNAIGVVGLNWLVQPNEMIKGYLKNVKSLAVLNSKDGKYYKPTQKNIGEGNYPLSRKLYLLDFQGKSGLGMGFASYIAGYKGQKIILKSGLAPFMVHPREIIVRKTIE